MATLTESQAAIRLRKVTQFPSRMASRNLEIKPVGAWVQPEVDYKSEHVDAVVRVKI